MAYFNGFQPADFETIDGTTWRSREGFGGEVVDRIGCDLESWAVYGWQGFQIGPRRDGQPVPESAKLFVNAGGNEIHGSCLAYGLYVECDCDKTNAHWRNLVDGLQNDERMRQWLVTAIKDHDLNFGKFAGDCDHDPKWLFRSEGGRLYRADGDSRKAATVDDIISAVIELPEEKYVDFYIYAQMCQADAIAAGKAVIEPVSKLLLLLVRFYFLIRYRGLTTAK